MLSGKARIAVLVSGGGTNLQALIDAEDAGALKSGEIALVVSNRKAAFGLERAKKHGVRTAVISSAMVPDPDERDEKLLELLQGERIDVIVLAGYLDILKHRVVRAYENKIINIHPSLIPAFCGDGFYGLRVHEAALKRGVKLTGATAHLVNLEVDGGPILLQKAVPVEAGDTPETLQRRVMEQAEWLLLPAATELVCAKLIDE